MMAKRWWRLVRRRKKLNEKQDVITAQLLRSDSNEKGINGKSKFKTIRLL